MLYWLGDKANRILLDDWKHIASHSWSFWITVFSVVLWSAMGGLILVWSAFEDLLPKGAFIGIGICLNIAIGIARLTKQPGADE